MTVWLVCQRHGGVLAVFADRDHAQQYAVSRSGRYVLGAHVRTTPFEEV